MVAASATYLKYNNNSYGDLILARARPKAGLFVFSLPLISPLERALKHILQILPSLLWRGPG
jgi:hypothetical protein